MSNKLIVSPDTKRPDRLPPGHKATSELPTQHLGQVPPFDPATWNLRLFPSPYVQPITVWNWQEFQRLPRVRVLADIHCGDGKSKLNNLWGGVSTSTLMENVRIADNVRYVMVHCEFGFSTNLHLDDFLAEDSLLACSLDGKDLTPEQGYPVRLVIPRLFASKSAKWVRGIEFMTTNQPGFRERLQPTEFLRRGDPWKDPRPNCHPRPE